MSKLASRVFRLRLGLRAWGAVASGMEASCRQIREQEVVLSLNPSVSNVQYDMRRYQYGWFRIGISGSGVMKSKIANICETASPW